MSENNLTLSGLAEKGVENIPTVSRIMMRGWGFESYH